MHRRRLLFIGLAAVVAGSVLSSVVYRTLQRQMAPAKPGVSVVVAARDLIPGQKLEERDLRVVTYPADFLPSDVLHTQISATRRWAAVPIWKGDFVTASKLTDDAGLPGQIPVGMRAAPVSVNDVISVAGFAKPSTRVDVLVTGYAPDSRKLQTSTVLQNILVLAAGNQLEHDASSGGREAHVVTLLVSPEDAEKLTLATQEGHIQLIIRNPHDPNREKREAVRNLYDTPAKKKSIRVTDITPSAPIPPPEVEIQLIRGGEPDKVLKVK